MKIKNQSKSNIKEMNKNINKISEENINAKKGI